MKTPLASSIEKELLPISMKSKPKHDRTWFGQGCIIYISMWWLCIEGFTLLSRLVISTNNKWFIVAAKIEKKHEFPGLLTKLKLPQFSYIYNTI